MSLHEGSLRGRRRGAGGLGARGGGGGVVV